MKPGPTEWYGAGSRAKPTTGAIMNVNGDAIQYGMFIMPFHMSGKPLAHCLDEDLELVVRAEELGFGEFWIGEHHTM